jgi:hypothetical protein
VKPGDLVRVTAPCNSEIKWFRGGEIGLIIGWAEDPKGIIRNDLVTVLFPEGRINFATHLLEIADD